MAKWNGAKEWRQGQQQTDVPRYVQKSPEKGELESTPKQYRERVSKDGFEVLQRNLQNSLSIIDNEVTKNYATQLQNYPVVPRDRELEKFQPIQFFKITELVYQENEFSVHKLATVFHTLSHKPCTLVLMIQSDRTNNNFYLGVRPKSSEHAAGTMRRLLEQSLLGLFPGSKTEAYPTEKLNFDMERLAFETGCVASVTCVADYKQGKDAVLEDKEFFQGLEKFIYSMQGKAFTAICIANSLEHADLLNVRTEYEKIYTMISPFASMQYNYAENTNSSVSNSKATSQAEGRTEATTYGESKTEGQSTTQTTGESHSQNRSSTEGNHSTHGRGNTTTAGTTQGTHESESDTNTVGFSSNSGFSGGIGFKGTQVGTFSSVGVSSSVSRAKSHGTSHTDSLSRSISENLSYGINRSRTTGNSMTESESYARTENSGTSVQHGKTEGRSTSVSVAETKSLMDAIGNSQAVTLNIQNKSLMSTLQRLEKQLIRLDECESIGMWDFAAYFLGETAAEAESAASMYCALVSGDQSGVQTAAVNTWTEEHKVKEILKYVQSFCHPVFRYQFTNDCISHEIEVDASSLSSTNELAIQLGLPRKSIKGLPVIEHAVFAQEILSKDSAKENEGILIGRIHHLGKDQNTKVSLGLQSLAMHAFITGSTGSGKSNTVYQILEQLPSHSVSFLVIEPAKGEYKNVFGTRRDVHVLGTNPQITDMLRINPFRFPMGVHILEHIDRLIEIFNVCWPMYAAMPAVLKEAVLQAYMHAGWDLEASKNHISQELFPTFLDLQKELEDVVRSSAYSDEVKGNYIGSLVTRVKSLTNGLNGMIFSANEVNNDTLFDSNVIVDLSRVGSLETKALIMGVLVMRLNEHRMTQATEMNAPLRHVTVLEEAHNILKRTATEQSAESPNLTGKSVEMLSNSIAEMRTYGEGFIIADQSPSAVDVSAIRNTNTKIIMRLPDENDRRVAGKSAALRDDQLDEIAKLSKGVAVVYQNDWLEPVLCHISKFSGQEQPFQYDKMRVVNPSSNCNDAWVKRETLTLLMGDRLPKHPELDIDRLMRELPNASLPTRDKIRISQYVREYQATGSLRIWKNEKFADLSKMVTELLGCKLRVENLIKTAFNFDELNRGFSELIQEQVAEVNRDLELSLCQCFMKSFSEDYPEQLGIYAAWEDDIRKERGMVI